MTSMPLMAIHIVPTTKKLFNDQLTTTGIVVLVLILVGLIVWLGLGFFQELRKKWQDQLPGVLGDPDELFEQTSNLALLGVSERHVLKKVAWRMKLPQPASILLSPTLLVEAAEVWKESHGLSPTRQWGLHQLNEIARKIYNQSLDQLETRTR